MHEYNDMGGKWVNGSKDVVKEGDALGFWREKNSALLSLSLEMLNCVTIQWLPKKELTVTCLQAVLSQFRFVFISVVSHLSLLSIGFVNSL